MSGADSDVDRADELTARYRAASAADPTRPSDAARESIFAYARTVAVNHATRAMASARGRTAGTRSSPARPPTTPSRGWSSAPGTAGA